LLLQFKSCAQFGSWKENNWSRNGLAHREQCGPPPVLNRPVASFGLRPCRKRPAPHAERTRRRPPHPTALLPPDRRHRCRLAAMATCAHSLILLLLEQENHSTPFLFPASPRHHLTRAPPYSSLHCSACCRRTARPSDPGEALVRPRVAIKWSCAACWGHGSEASRQRPSSVTTCIELCYF
jgi:hypothetical protein